jgi:gpW protein
MPETLATLQANLADAQNKRHQLLTGRLSVEVVQEGKGTVRYQRTDLDAIEAYIEDLERRICGRPVRYGAIGFIL